jgi:hypothetical protein
LLLATSAPSVRVSDTPTHFHVIANHVPDWLRAADPKAVQAYATALRQSRASQATAQYLASDFIEPAEFARSRLQAAFDAAFAPAHGVDVARAEWVEFDRGSAIMGRPLSVRRRTLLEAAMANFSEDEASPGYFDSATVLLQPDALQLRLNEHAKGWSYAWHYQAKDTLAVSPDQFARLCRELDLGHAYQQHFNGVFKPTASRSQWVTRAFLANVRAELVVQAQQALLRGHLDAVAYSVVEQVLVDKPGEVKWQGQSVILCDLRALVTWVHGGTTLHGLVCIQTSTQSSAPCIVYMPGAADGALKQYPSFDAFSTELRSKLRDGAFQRYFAQFVAEPDRREFFLRLNNALRPQRMSWGVAQGPMDDPDADIGLRRTPHTGPLVPGLHAAMLARHAADARYFIVATADIDAAERQARWLHYLEQGVTLLNVAALSVPALGVLMAAAATVQLLGELFVGMDDWTHGQTEEAAAHFFDVAANLALVGATAAAGVALARSPFVAGMLPVVDRAGRTCLWPTTLEAFAAREPLPETVVPNAQWQYAHGGSNYIKHEGRFYRQSYDVKTATWYIEHPAADVDYRLALAHNGEGAWRADHEDPERWTAIQALRRFGPALEGLDDAALQRVRQVSGISGRQLRHLHRSGGKLPALIKACIDDLRAEQTVLGLPVNERVAALARLREVAPVLAARHPATPLLRDFPSLPQVVAEEIAASASDRERTQLVTASQVPLRLASQARSSLWEVQLNRAILGLTGAGNGQTAALRKGLMAGMSEQQQRTLLPHKLLAMAVRDRPRAAWLIGQRRPRTFLAPERVAGDRWGYRLSGRGGRGGEGQDERVQPTQPLSAARQQARIDEGRRLDTSLGRWAQEDTPTPGADGQAIAVVSADRELARQRIMAAWRGEAPLALDDAGELSQVLDLSELRIGTLPVLEGDFSRVRYLSLEQCGLTELTPGFLEMFPHLEHLELQSNHLTRIPPGITALGELQMIALDDNRLQASPTMFDEVASLPSLEALVLRDNPMQLPEAAVQRLANLSSLRYLALDNTDGQAMAEHLPILARMPNLESLWLGRNGMTLTPEAMQALGRLRSLDYLNLSGNPLGAHLDLSLLEDIGALGLRDCQLQEWPSGLTALMDRQPMRLRWVELDDNPIVEIPPLHALAFFRGEPRVPRPLSLSFAHLNAVAVSRLQAVGVVFDYLQILTQSADVEAAARLAGLRAMPGSERFVQILGRLSDTADYRTVPASLAERAWRVIDAAAASPSLREQLFAIAQRPETCGDQVMALFADLEQQQMYHQAADPALDGPQRSGQLLGLSRSLYRLDRVDSLALADVRARAAARDIDVDEMEEVEVLLAYRIGLSARLGLLNQPHGLLFGAIEPVTPAQLDAVASQVLQQESDATLLEWHMSQAYWLDYLRREHRVRLDAARAPWLERQAQLQARDYDSTYDETLVSLQVELQAAEMTVLRALTQEAMAQ